MEGIIDKPNLIKMKNFSVKNMSREWEDKPHSEKILAKDTSDKGLLSKYI